MSMQQALPQHPRYLIDWVIQWNLDHYPTGIPSDKEAKEWRDEMWNDLPHRFVPDIGGLTESWWVEAIQGIARRLPDTMRVAYRDIPQGGARGAKFLRVVGVQLKLPFDDFRTYEIQKASAAARDKAAIHRDVEEYAAANPSLQLDPAAVFTDICNAAGL
jgi:hypothetical protein